MTEIHYQFPVRASAARVFAAIATPEGLDAWWTLQASGSPGAGNVYALGFGAGYEWGAIVSVCVEDAAFEFTMMRADADWEGTKVGFLLAEKGGTTEVRFYHAGWSRENDHYRISSFCWAMYLRLLRRYCESGEVTRYDDRLEA